MNSDGSGKQVVVDGDQIQNKVDWGHAPLAARAWLSRAEALEAGGLRGLLTTT